MGVILSVAYNNVMSSLKTVFVILLQAEPIPGVISTNNFSIFYRHSFGSKLSLLELPNGGSLLICFTYFLFFANNFSI